MRLRSEVGVEVIATGDEILFGRIVDTNSSWIARRAAEVGARLRRVTSVGDDIDEIARALREALSRGNGFVILTGGLGPSDDDVTIDAIGRAVGRAVELRPEAVETLRRKCTELGVEMTPRRERMARLLEGSEPIPNPVGMSTGMALREGATTVVALPGIPEEMTAMFDGYVAPMIEGKASSRYLGTTVGVRIVWNEFFPMYNSLLRDFADVYLKNAATPPLMAEERERVHEIDVDIVVQAPTRAECERKMEAFLGELRSRAVARGGELIMKPGCPSSLDRSTSPAG